MAFDLLNNWRSAFGEQLQKSPTSEGLKAASLAEDLRTWTSELTSAIVRSCTALGWDAAGKRNACQRLPKAGQEYLGIDVMAFPASCDDGPPWPMPLAAFELENSRDDDRVAYSLWKVLCLRVPLRVVFAYRPDWDQGRRLVGTACESVVGGMDHHERPAIGGQTLLVVGNRGEGQTFPWGYFKFWLLNANLGRFEKI